jgi:ammonium transporter, Amt family
MRSLKAFWPIPIFFLAALLAGILPAPNPIPTGGELSPGDVAWMLAATGLVLFMTPGLAFFYGGMVQKKNVISTMLQSFIAMGLVSLLWVVVGFSLAFGDSLGGVIGNPLTFFMFRGVGGATHPDLAPTIPLALFALFQLKFAIITPALITGAFSERVRFSSLMYFVAFFTLFVYAPLAHWTWHPNGFLRQWGVLDYAGGTVVHMAAGFAALAGALILGRRKSHEAGQAHVPASVPFVLLGTGMLWFGWFGFNAGSALAANSAAVTAFLNTNTASAAAMLAWVWMDVIRGKKISAMGACIGAVVGLVAITPASGYVTVAASLIIGAGAALISNYAVHLRSKSTLDDTLDVFPCHGVGGMVGMIATGLFAQDVGLAYGKTSTFLFHMLALVVVGAFTFGGSWILYQVIDLFSPLRVSAEAEAIGLDLFQHGESLEEGGWLDHATAMVTYDGSLPSGGAVGQAAVAGPHQ